MRNLLGAGQLDFQGESGWRREFVGESEVVCGNYICVWTVCLKNGTVNPVEQHCQTKVKQKFLFHKFRETPLSCSRTQCGKLNHL